MKSIMNLVLGIVLLSFPIVVSSSSAAPGKPFNQTDMFKIDKFKKQIINQGPILKEKLRQKKNNGQTGSLVSGSNKKKKLDVNIIKRQVRKETGNIKLVLNASKDINFLSDQLKDHGARLIRKRNNKAVIEVPIENLENLFSEVKSIKNARLPLRLYPQAVESEGVALTHSDDFHNLAYYGAGVKIAVIDVGFKGLTEAIENGDLPNDILTHAIDYSENGLETDYYHGTACAEIIHDMAPQAELHLLKVLYSEDLVEALNYCIDNSIDIMSLSIGTTGTGPGDGTGPLDEAFDIVRANGILPIAAAGNNGITTIGDGENSITLGTHWKGVFNDLPPADNQHEFVAGNGDVLTANIFGAYPTTDDDGDPDDSEVSVLLRWNDWITTDTDYDMILSEYNEDTKQFEEIAWSTYPQNGDPDEYQEPVEYISVDIPDEEDYLHIYSIQIVKESGAPNVEMELHLGGTSSFLPYDENTGPIATSSSSITEPADAESVLAVGVIDYANWETGPQEDFSSRGPTNAWAGSAARVKPDVMGPDGITTFTYGDTSFNGASAATPHVAGLAALILNKYPNMIPDDIQESIETYAIDMGATGRDNIYGWGRIEAETDLSVIVNPPPATGSSGGGGGGGGGGGCFITSAASGSFSVYWGLIIALVFIAILSIFIVITSNLDKDTKQQYYVPASSNK